jgi:hypothetical protein
MWKVYRAVAHGAVSNDAAVSFAHLMVWGCLVALVIVAGIMATL